MNKWLPCIGILMSFSAVSLTTEIGTFGDVWEIAEQNLLTVIEGQVESAFLGNEEKIQQEWRERVTKNAERPEPVQRLTKALKNTTRTFDPSFTVTKDIRDHNGIVFARKGQKVNPFDITPLMKRSISSMAMTKNNLPGLPRKNLLPPSIKSFW
ncbi:hypothetical protein WH390_15885 (plasmid) [Candidatus Arsenophonus nilaparvatae]|uniref:hypothetical protein n=1 Tax=Candidatus Arsenophonus nilaparvatae TaxID=1247023 RepID=UPI0037C03CEA